jgi:hypothetical protein
MTRTLSALFLGLLVASATAVPEATSFADNAKANLRLLAYKTQAFALQTQALAFEAAGRVASHLPSREQLLVAGESALSAVQSAAQWAQHLARSGVEHVRALPWAEIGRSPPVQAVSDAVHRVARAISDLISTSPLASSLADAASDAGSKLLASWSKLLKRTRKTPPLHSLLFAAALLFLAYNLGSANARVARKAPAIESRLKAQLRSLHDAAGHARRAQSDLSSALASLRSELVATVTLSSAIVKAAPELAAVAKKTVASLNADVVAYGTSIAEELRRTETAGGGAQGKAQPAGSSGAKGKP